MRDLFENLLISSPNEGGLFFYHDSELFCLDRIDTTGLFYGQDTLLRSFQPDKLCIYGNPVRLISGANGNFDDVHSVLWANGHCYLAATAGNEIIQLTDIGEEVQRWTFSGEKDSWHINCLAFWRGRVIFSAFGDFGEHRGYKGKTIKAGFVQDLLSGERLIHGLSQPHSLLAVDDRLFLANSELMELIEFSADGKILRSKQLDGYTRGLVVSGSIVYVGLSRSRNIDYSDIAAATIVALDRKTFEEIGRMQLPTNEIYDIQHISDSKQLGRVLAALGSTSSAMLNESNDERDGQIANLSQAVTERDGQIANLSQALAENQRQMEQILTSKSWRITRPLRAIERLLQNRKIT